MADSLTIALASTSDPSTAMAVQGALKSTEFLFSKFKSLVIPRVTKDMVEILKKVKDVFENEISKNIGLMPDKLTSDTLNMAIKAYQNIGKTSDRSASYKEEGINLLASVIEDLYLEPLTENVLYKFMNNIIDLILNIHDPNEAGVSFDNGKQTELLLQTVFLMVKNSLGIKDFMPAKPTLGGGRKNKVKKQSVRNQSKALVSTALK